MILIVGGAYQGKKNFAESLVCGDEKRLFLNAHEYVENEMKAGRTQDEIKESLSSILNEDSVITCDEVGCGIIPADESEISRREITGRILCDIAAKSDTVYRVTAGIPLKIKG